MHSPRGSTRIVPRSSSFNYRFSTLAKVTHEGGLKTLTFLVRLDRLCTHLGRLHEQRLVLVRWLEVRREARVALEGILVIWSRERELYGCGSGTYWSGVAGGASVT